MIEKAGRSITSLDDWRDRAGPKRPEQWRTYRSALESARFWVRHGPQLPAEVASLLNSREDFGPILDWTGEPEASVRFDTARGEPPNIDLLISARDERGPLVIGIEAKADEPFGSLVETRAADALEALTENPRSGALRRVAELVESLFDGATRGAPKVGQLRYQLLTLCGAVVAEASRMGCTRAVALVHEFETPATDADLQLRNENDLDLFVHRLSGEATRMEAGRLVGPFRIHKGPLFKDADVDLFMGLIYSVVSRRAEDEHGDI